MTLRSLMSKANILAISIYYYATCIIIAMLPWSTVTDETGLLLWLCTRALQARYAANMHLRPLTFTRHFSLSSVAHHNPLVSLALEKYES